MKKLKIIIAEANLLIREIDLRQESYSTFHKEIKNAAEVYFNREGLALTSWRATLNYRDLITYDCTFIHDKRTEELKKRGRFFNSRFSLGEGFPESYLEMDIPELIHEFKISDIKQSIEIAENEGLQIKARNEELTTEIESLTKELEALTNN